MNAARARSARDCEGKDFLAIRTKAGKRAGETTRGCVAGKTVRSFRLTAETQGGSLLPLRNLLFGKRMRLPQSAGADRSVRPCALWEPHPLPEKKIPEGKQASSLGFRRQAERTNCFSGDTPPGGFPCSFSRFCTDCKEILSFAIPCAPRTRGVHTSS